MRFTAWNIQRYESKFGFNFNLNIYRSHIGRYSTNYTTIAYEGTSSINKSHHKVYGK